MGQVDGKVCIVTGGAGSIGLASVQLLLAEGAKVALVDVDEARLAKAAAGLDPDRVITIAADVAKTDQVKAYVERTVATWGKIDVFFSNAGNDGPIVPTIDYPEEIFDSIIATHVRGCFLGCKYVIPQMNDGGSIIITSSITGVKGVAGNCSYVAAKHALMGLMRCIAKEVAQRGIRVNTVNPGPIDNEFMRTAERHMSGLLGRDAGEFFDEMIPLGRHGRPEEIARAVLFLASDHSAYTSGSALMLDGGLCA
jgi:NAD(P)-dependent dehydrogenase (short-subunit alcohol dehydrogenase family)